MSTNIIEFPEVFRKRKQVSGSSETASGTSGKGTRSVEQREFEFSRVEGAIALDPIPIDVLYPASENNRRDLLQALQVLPSVVRALEDARDALRADDIMQSDHHVHSMQMLLPDLFRCRTIGDGFGTVINALEIALVNQRGEPLVEKQILAALRALKELRSHPFITFDSAQQSVEELAKAGLQVDPVSLGDLIDVSP
jgi:hypothetical protein